MSTSDLVPHTAKSPPDGFAGWRIRGRPAYWGLGRAGKLRNIDPKPSPPQFQTHQLHSSNLLWKSNSWHKSHSFWCGHSASTEFAIKNLKSENGLGLCRPNESDRETDRKWGLEVGAGANLIGNVKESNESKYFEIHCDFYPLTFLCPKAQRKRKTAQSLC